MYVDHTKHAKATEDHNVIRARIIGWKLKFEESRKSIITTKVRKAITTLLIHIEKGCLSNIPPKLSTSGSELFHKHLNALINEWSNVSPVLMSAFITYLLYSYDRRKSSNMCYEKFKNKVKLKKIHTSRIRARPGIFQSQINSVEYTDWLNKDSTIPLIKNNKHDSRNYLNSIASMAEKIFDAYMYSIKQLKC